MFTEGELVGVACSIQPGPFSDEHLVMVETEDGTISGFVKQTDLEISDGERGYVKGAVLDAARDSILVRMFGSFFTTALGVVSVRRNSLMHLAVQ